MDENHQAMQRIESQIRQKLNMKRGYRKKAKVILEKIMRSVSRRLLPSEIEIRKYTGNSLFGCDELGRDVEDGLRKYVLLLKSRGVKMHTVIVLGSRAKGNWKPQSDIDITIVADSLPEEGKNLVTRRLSDLRSRAMLSDRPVHMGIEPSGCCSREEFSKRLNQFDIQVLDAMLYGKVIYDDGFWPTAKASYEMLVKRHGLEEASLKRMLALV